MAMDTGAAGATEAALQDTGATKAAATSVPGTTQSTTGAPADAGKTDPKPNNPAPQASAAPPLDTLLSGLETLGSEVIDLGLSSLSLQVNLPLGDGSKASLALYLTPPAAPTTSGTAPKGGSLDDVISSVRTAVNDSAVFGETMTVEQGYVCVTSVQRV